MTVASDVKQCLASLKGIEADLSSLAILTQDHNSKRVLHESMMEVNEIVENLKKRIGELEREERQYEGF
ncbi:hypothetical protein BTO30_10475 [Domibacillus antri]|uniref:DUF1657 domain-containing protein n=1 Tax=Domibacillus antri TaxID=1714264 RepID=A0A1Q8Q499_9BACI|nr:DUF1657 domain-containing protein [Domibacillus antri]OLN22170.1 hypothetical protein BTO30_10475 [Domibacillus antri]